MKVREVSVPVLVKSRIFLSLKGAIMKSEPHPFKKVSQLRMIFGWDLSTLVVIAAALFFGEGQRIMAEPSTETAKKTDEALTTGKADFEQATFGSGCFWCTEAVFQQLKGVKSVVSGYCGGHTKNPTYDDVCTGKTGHAEVIHVTYDPKVVSYPELLEVFWKTHDPTTLNQQGNDKGTQYRSVIFFYNDQQKKLATEYKKKLDESGAYKKPIVTEITAAKQFYAGEEYHQNFYRTHPNHGYCNAIIKHKVEKFREVFKDKLKEE